MILNWILLIVALAFLSFVALGAVSVWFRDEHEPIWTPPEPTRIRPKPMPYDWNHDPDRYRQEYDAEIDDDAPY
jgi:hypothetical protein